MGLEKWYNLAKSDNLFFEIAKGNIPNHFSVVKFGENPVVGTSEVTVWDGLTLYNGYLETPSKLTITSDDSADIFGGTGAQIVRVSGLDLNYNYVSENINMNGLDGTITENVYSRSFRLSVELSGSGATAAGDIYAGTGTITLGVPDNVHSRIRAGNNKTLMSLITVPSGYTGYIVNIDGSVGSGKDAKISLVTRKFESNTWAVQGKGIASGNSFTRTYSLPEPILEKTDVELRVSVSSTPAVSVTGDFDIVFVKNNNDVPDIIK